MLAAACGELAAATSLTTALFVPRSALAKGLVRMQESCFVVVNVTSRAGASHGEMRTWHPRHTALPREEKMLKRLSHPTVSASNRLN